MQKSEIEKPMKISKAIVSECNYNQHILDVTFKNISIDNLKKYPTFNILTTKFSSQQIQTAIFLKYANSNILAAIQDYTRLCEIANLQKDSINALRRRQDTNDTYLERYKTAMDTTIKYLARSIAVI